MLGEALVMFFQWLAANGKYPVPDCENFELPIQMQLSQKQNIFLNFLIRFRNLREILNILKKRKIVIANVFPKLQTFEILVRPLCK